MSTNIDCKYDSDECIKIGIIGGTGLESIADVCGATESAKELLAAATSDDGPPQTPYGPASHMLFEATIQGTKCILLSRHGKQHQISPTNINYRANIWALQQAGADIIVATTACGSLREVLAPGHIVVLDSFIDRTTKREQTFYDGCCGHPKGICHMPMQPAFNEKLRAIIKSSCHRLNIPHQGTGTMVCVEGPRFSTLAESRLFRQWDADLVGMTVCPEAVLAKELGIPYASIGIVTDYDCWKESVENVNIELVTKLLHSRKETIKHLIIDVVNGIAKEEKEFLEEAMKVKVLAQSSVML